MTEPAAGDLARIYIDIVGDLLHAGHVRHLQKARALGDWLVVGIFDDDTAARLSHRPIMPMAERIAVVGALGCVDEIVADAPLAPDTAFLEKLDIAYACLSDDYDDPERQEALADLLEDGMGVVIPYTDDVTTAQIVGRIAGDGKTLEKSAPPPRDAAPEPADRQLSIALDAIGALASAQFRTDFHKARQELGDEGWLALLRGYADNEVRRATSTATDPRFVPALTGTVAKALTPGSAVNLIGAESPFVAAALAASGHDVCVLRPGRSAPGNLDGIANEVFRTVHCGWEELPDATPPADMLAVMDTAAAGWLLLHPDKLQATVARQKTGLLLAVDLSPTDAQGYTPGPTGGFLFTDHFVRDQLHRCDLYEAQDILTVLDGAPLPDGAPGCSRLSRVSQIAEDRHGITFRYLDGEPAKACGDPKAGGYLRWYRASGLSLSEPPA